jgi:hypothetical protein
MNNLGFSNDNLHIGDVRIKGQNETLRIGNENGGDGYILPTEKGTVGQVITMNADNSTSFQDAPTPPGLTGRIVKNLFVMRERTSFYNTLPTSAQALFQTGYGSNDVLIGDFPVNSTIHIYSRGVISFDASVVASGTGVFQLEIDDGVGSVVYFTSNNLTLSKQGTANQNRFYHLDFIFQRTGTNTYRVDGYGLASDGSNGQIKMGFVETSYSPVAPYTQFTIKATYYKIVSTPGEEYIPIAQVYINDLILDTSLLISPPPAPTSHTALTDLTAGDAGHTQFALLGGRPLGQTISGGITPSEFLTLKSHTASTLNNIVIKDLNSTFEKNIDMNQNQINNCLVINNQAGQPLNLIGGSNVSAVILDATPTQGVIIGSNVGASTDITGDTSLSLRCNAGSIDLFPSTLMSVIIGGLPRFAVDSTQVNVGNDLNMNNNNINNVLNINSGTNINLNPTGLVDCNGDIDMGSNRIIGVPEIVGDGTNMTIRNGSGISILLDQATNKVALLNNNLDMNNNQIDNANIITSSGNLTLNAGGTGQSIQMDGSFITFFQGGGSFVPTITPSSFDMNNGGITNVSSINGFTAVGGVFAGTSDSLTLTASTAEQSILPTTFVGGLTVPANGFSIGDSFHLVLAGDFGSQNGDTINIRLYGGATSTVVLADLVVPLVASSGVSFEVEVDFQLRNIGGTTIADICSNFDFTYNGGAGGAFRGERGVFQNNTTFDTTTNNVLLVTAQFSSANANNSIKTSVSKLSKTF